MDNQHPKRKKDQFNNYELIRNENGYYLSFIDGQSVKQTICIDIELYNLLNSFELEDISYMNVISRHYEHSKLTPQTLHERTFCNESSIEDDAIKNIQYKELYKAISKLPEIQKRRLELYYLKGLTYAQIAKVEKCSTVAIKYSIDIAISKLKDELGHLI